MTQLSKEATIAALTKIFQDNVGNRLTVALANGMLQVLDAELTQAEVISRAMVAGGQTGALEGVVVRGDA